MRSIRIAILALVLTLCAGGAYAQISKEKTALCTGAGVCVAGIVVQWPLGTRVEFALDDDTGCTGSGADTYTIFGTNTGGTIAHQIGVLQNIVNVSSLAFEPAIWFPSFTIVPSATAGCTSLVISMWITRPRL